MKVIDLLNKLNTGENMPEKIKVDGYHLKYDNVEKFYQTEYKRDLLEIGKDYSTYEFLNFKVEILNNEIIQDEIDIKETNWIEETNWQEVGELLGKMYLEVGKGFEKAIKQLNKKMEDK